MPEQPLIQPSPKRYTRKWCNRRIGAQFVGAHTSSFCAWPHLSSNVSSQVDRSLTSRRKHFFNKKSSGCWLPIGTAHHSSKYHLSHQLRARGDYSDRLCHGNNFRPAPSRLICLHTVTFVGRSYTQSHNNNGKYTTWSRNSKWAIRPVEIWLAIVRFRLDRSAPRAAL